MNKNASNKYIIARNRLDTIAETVCRGVGFSNCITSDFCAIRIINQDAIAIDIRRSDGKGECPCRRDGEENAFSIVHPVWRPASDGIPIRSKIVSQK